MTNCSRSPQILHRSTQCGMVQVVEVVNGRRCHENRNGEKLLNQEHTPLPLK